MAIILFTMHLVDKFNIKTRRKHLLSMRFINYLLIALLSILERLFNVAKRRNFTIGSVSVGGAHVTSGTEYFTNVLRQIPAYHHFEWRGGG